MNDDTDNKKDTPDMPVAEHHYQYENLDGYGAEGEEVVNSTDPDSIAEEVFSRSKDESDTFDDSNDPDDVPSTDLGGLYNRDTMYDEDAEGGEADVVGHSGIDDDTG